MNNFNNFFHRMLFTGEESLQCILTTSNTGNIGRNSEPENDNRKKIRNMLGVEKIITLTQAHTKTVFDVKQLRENEIFTGDGLLTSGNDVLAVTVADCLPIFLYDSRKKVYAIVHSGWKGTGIAANAVRIMTDKYFSNPEDIEAVIGPSIGCCCYSVDAGRAEIFGSEWGAETVSYRDGKYYLDLKKANKMLLAREGLCRIQISDICTCCSGSFFSYRRDGAKDFSLMLALIGYFG